MHCLSQESKILGHTVFGWSACDKDSKYFLSSDTKYINRMALVFSTKLFALMALVFDISIKV